MLDDGLEGLRVGGPPADGEPEHSEAAANTAPDAGFDPRTFGVR